MDGAVAGAAAKVALNAALDLLHESLALGTDCMPTLAWRSNSCAAWLPHETQQTADVATKSKTVNLL